MRMSRSSLIVVAVGCWGCGPRLIQDYAVRQNEFFFVVQEGMGYAVGDCQRKPTGELSDCRTYSVDFR